MYIWTQNLQLSLTQYLSFLSTRTIASAGCDSFFPADSNHQLINSWCASFPKTQLLLTCVCYWFSLALGAEVDSCGPNASPNIALRWNHKIFTNILDGFRGDWGAWLHKVILEIWCFCFLIRAVLCRHCLCRLSCKITKDGTNVKFVHKKYTQWPPVLLALLVKLDKMT